jgi:hypothetical protein
LAIGFLSIDADDRFAGEWSLWTVALYEPAVTQVFAAPPALLNNLPYCN